MSCLFVSLINNCKNDPKKFKVNHVMLRNQIVDFISTDPILFDRKRASQVVNWLGRGTLAQYCREMRNTSTWGGALEVRAFCIIFETNVEVDFVDKKKKIYFACPKREAKTIKIKYNGGHYW